MWMEILQQPRLSFVWDNSLFTCWCTAGWGNIGLCRWLPPSDFRRSSVWWRPGPSVAPCPGVVSGLCLGSRWNSSDSQPHSASQTGESLYGNNDINILILFFLSFVLLKAGDIIVQNLGTFLLLEKILWEQFELHDHVGQSGRDFLLEEKIGVSLIMRFARVQQFLNRYWSWRVPSTSIYTWFLGKITIWEGEVPGIFI